MFELKCKLKKLEYKWKTNDSLVLACAKLLRSKCLRCVRLETLWLFLHFKALYAGHFLDRSLLG